MPTYTPADARARVQDVPPLYAQALDRIASGLPAIVQQQGREGVAWYLTLDELMPSLELDDVQRERLVGVVQAARANVAPPGSMIDNTLTLPAHWGRYAVGGLLAFFVARSLFRR